MYLVIYLYRIHLTLQVMLGQKYFENSWYCFDTSNQLFVPNSHIYVAIGRNYWDVAPVRGIRERGGIESMNSIVQVLAC